MPIAAVNGRQAWQRALGLAALGVAALGLVGSLALAGDLPASAAGDGNAPPAPWRVVILTGADPTQPAVQRLDGRFRQALADRAPQGAAIFADHLDSLRFQGADLAPELLTLLQKKYAHQKIDLVVGLTEFSLDFIDRHRDRIWPGAQVLVYGIDEQSLRAPALPSGISYQPWRLEFDATLALAEVLQPRARRLVLVSGVSPFDRQLADRAAAAAARRAPGRWPTVEAWNGLTLAELRSRLAGLDADTAVLYTAMYRDRLGGVHFPLGVLSAMKQVSGAPIYGLYQTFIDGGLTAGSVVDFDAVADRTAATAAAILAGALPTTGEPLPPLCVADAMQLAAFGIDTGRLPAGCTLINAQPGLWQTHRTAVLLTAAVLLLQSASIAGLLWQRRRRQIAEGDALEQRIELGRATRLAAMGELSAAIAHEIRQPLGAILSNTDAAEMMIDSGQIDLQQLREILADIRSDDLRAHEVIRRLRALLQKQQVEHAPLDLHDTLAGALALLAPEAERRGMRIEPQFSARSSGVIGDTIQLQQVLVNLVRNAMDAMEGVAAERRRLTVSTADTGAGLELRVTDNGHGIAAENATRLFESFFSTKPRGMGMGLSIVRSIVEAHGGAVRAEAAPGQGSTFVVQLPRADPPAAGVSAQASEAAA
jgi:signal transduction histidine kinase